MRRRGWLARRSKCIEIYELSCRSRLVPAGTFDAAEGLMPRFSPGFHVGSMKNVSLALLALVTATIAVLAPALPLGAFRRHEVCFKVAAFEPVTERTALIAFALRCVANTRAPTCARARAAKLLSQHCICIPKSGTISQPALAPSRRRDLNSCARARCLHISLARILLNCWLISD